MLSHNIDEYSSEFHKLMFFKQNLNKFSNSNLFKLESEEDSIFIKNVINEPSKNLFLPDEIDWNEIRGFNANTADDDYKFFHMRKAYDTSNKIIEENKEKNRNLIFKIKKIYNLYYWIVEVSQFFEIYNFD